MTNKFVGSMVTVNPEVDMDIDLVKSMLQSEKGRVELYQSAASTEGEVFIVDGDVTRAEALAGMLNEAYQEFMALEAEATSDDSSEARNKVNTAFEGESRVPVSESAEDAALANLEKKNIVKKTKTTNKKETVTMTNNTNVNKEVAKTQSTAAKAFLAGQEGKMQNAKQSAKKGTQKEDKKVNTTKPSVGTKKEATKPSVNKNTVAQPNVNTNTKGENTMKTTNNETKGNRTTAGTTGAAGRKSAGTTVKLNTNKIVSNASNRIDFQESANQFNRFQGPWYLNASLHPMVAQLEELVAMRKLDVAGIKDIRFVDPNSVLRYENHGVKSIVEVTVAGKKGDNTWSIRIQDETREGKTADLKSSNIGWETEDGELRPVYQYFKKNEENHVTFFGEKGSRITAGLEEAVVFEGLVRYTNVDEEGTVHGFTFDPATQEITALDDKAYTIQAYVPVVKKEVTPEVLVLALAFAQYAHGLDMHGVVEEA